MLEKVGKLGALGDRVTVKGGYARTSCSTRASRVGKRGEYAEFEARRAELEKTAQEQIDAATLRAESLNGKQLRSLPKQATKVSFWLDRYP